MLSRQAPSYSPGVLQHGPPVRRAPRRAFPRSTPEHPKTMSNPALVQFKGVQKTYDGLSLVVRNLDLDIRRGEFL